MSDRPDTAEAGTRRLRFGNHVLDVDRGCLLRGAILLPLRPKTFAVLRYLVEHRGRLIGKDELFAAVWPNIAVTDDVLVQSISELRRALGEDGAALIKTVPRRGYRFDADVEPAQSETTSAPRVAVRVPADAVAGRRRLASLAVPLSLLLLALIVRLTAGLLVAFSIPDEQGLASAEDAASTRPVIAVLPLADQVGDPATAYFRDGVTEDIINALGRFSGLTVMSWNAVLPYRETPAAPADVVRALGVSYVVEGSLRQADDRLRVSAHLVDAAGHVLWSARFDKAASDVFALQDEISAEVVRALAVGVFEVEQRRILAKPTESLAAYDYVLRARPALQRPTRTGLVEARALLNRAIAIDPNYAAAYTGLAESYYAAASLGWAESPADTLGRAEQLALEALSLDAREVRARVILARIHVLHQSYAEAEAEIERAVAANPNDAQSVAGRGNVMMWLGRADEAIASLEYAERIDPKLSAIDRFALSLAYYLKGRFDAAVEEGELILRDSDASVFALPVLAAAYAKLDRVDDASRMVETIRASDPTFSATDFGTKFLNPRDLEALRDGFRRAGLLVAAR